MDDPVEIVDTAIDLHAKMIKQMKGVPGKLYGALSSLLLLSLIQLACMTMDHRI